MRVILSAARKPIWGYKAETPDRRRRQTETSGHIFVRPWMGLESGSVGQLESKHQLLRSEVGPDVHVGSAAVSFCRKVCFLAAFFCSRRLSAACSSSISSSLSSSSIESGDSPDPDFSLGLLKRSARIER